MKERIKHLILFIVLIGIDQASKYWVRTVLIDREPIVLIPKVLKLQYHTNTGAVWGLMSGKVGYLVIFTFVVLLLILFLYFKIPQSRKYNALKIIVVFIMAGAVGNLVDRLLLGHVVDFIYFEIINFPLFNFADSCLTVSSVLLFLLAIFYYKDEDFAFLDQIFKRKKAVKAADDGSKTSTGIAEADDASDEDGDGEADDAFGSEDDGMGADSSSDDEVYEVEADTSEDENSNMETDDASNSEAGSVEPDDASDNEDDSVEPDDASDNEAGNVEPDDASDNEDDSMKANDASNNKVD
jgi:signal peptidase II